MTTPVEMRNTNTKELATIVVGHVKDGALEDCKVFPETSEGNANAEKQFKQYILQNCSAVLDHEIDNDLEDGYCEYGNHYIFITHS